MELPEVCLTTGIKILLGTWVGIKVSQRIYNMCKSLHPKRTSKFSSGKVDKCRSRVDKGSSIRTWRKSNVEIEAFAVQKEIKHKTTLPVVKEEIEGNKYANQVYNDLDVDILEERGLEVSNPREIIDSVYTKEMKLQKDAVENLVNVKNEIQNKNNFDETEYPYKLEEESNIKMFEANVPINNIREKEDDDKEIKNALEDAMDLNNEKENLKSREGGFEEMDTENAQNMSDVDVEITDIGSHSNSHEIKDIDIDVDIKIEIDDEIKMPEKGFHWVRVKVPVDNFDDLYHEDIGFYEKEILSRIENQIIPVEIEDEFEYHDLVPANENKEKRSKINFITLVQTDSEHKQTVDNDTSGNDDKGIHLKLSNSKAHGMNFRKSISRDVDIDKYVEGHKYKTVKVFLRKLSIPGVTKVTGNESILLNETLEWEESDSTLGVKNTPSLLTIYPMKVTVNLDPLPS